MDTRRQGTHARPSIPQRDAVAPERALHPADPPRDGTPAHLDALMARAEEARFNAAKAIAACHLTRDRVYLAWPRRPRPHWFTYR